MEPKDAKDITNNVLIADALIRCKTMEKLLIAKGVFTKEEFQQTMGLVVDILTKDILQKAGVPGNLDEIIKSLKDKLPTQN